MIRRIMIMIKIMMNEGIKYLIRTKKREGIIARQNNKDKS